MGNPVELILDCLRDSRVPVAVEIRPNGGIGVQVLRAGNIAQHRPLPRFNNDRVLLRPLLHLGKRMPEITLVFVSERRWHKLLKTAARR